MNGKMWELSSASLFRLDVVVSDDTVNSTVYHMGVECLLISVLEDKM